MTEDGLPPIAQKVEVREGSAASNITQVVNYRRPPAGVPFLAPSLPEAFIERPEVVRPLKATLLSNETGAMGLGISALHGLGGIGKTTVAQALAHDPDVHARFPDGVLWVTLGREPELLPLATGWIQALKDYDFSSTSVEATSAHLQSLLHDKAALLVVDDIWDAAHLKPFRVGGGRCRLLLTTRDAAIARAERVVPYDLDVMTPDQAIALFRALLAPRVLPDSERAAARELAKAVGYLPLALELGAMQVADGIPWEELLADVRQEIARLEGFEIAGVADEEAAADEATLRRVSLRGCFNVSLRRLSSEKRAGFSWFGVLPEDAEIFPAMAAHLWDRELRDARDTLRYLKDKALLMSGSPLPDGTPTYRLHDLLHDMSRRLLTAPAVPPRPGDLPGLGLGLPHAHRQLIARYRAPLPDRQWQYLPDDGYIHGRLTWHMEQAGDFEQVVELLCGETAEGRNAWYVAQERLGQTASYLQDLARAREMAQTRARPCIEQGKPVTDLGLELRFVLMLTSLNSLAANIPAALLEALVRQGIWKPAQGLAYALRVSKAENRAWALAGIAPHLPQPDQQQAFQQALQSAQAIQDESSRARALAGIAPRLAQAGRFEQALQSAQAIQDEFTRARALAGIAPHLPATLLPQALQSAQAIQNEFSRARALAAFSTYCGQQSPERAYWLWSETVSCLTVCSRGEALEILPSLLPIVAALGGQQAATEICRAIQDVGRWWP